ncbi:MAG: site-specific DNA-methyltransferase [Flavobacteriales bacterium]|nr:site-specific DNA-methyltransferase [Flavobacteriales bacterium]
MAKIEDLIAQIPDERLRKAIAGEVKELKKTKKFGLVFEEHLPETVRLPSLPVKVGELVAKKKESGNELWRVRDLSKGIATLAKDVEGYSAAASEKNKVKVDELVVVRRFGEPIYPALKPVDRVARGGHDKPWHVLINADNFHALQLLLYCYEKQVDVIYIDPPYNSGARDWKYNNDYVDKTDTFRHSKWLSMMKKRLVLAKRLLSQSGSLVITIDENELNHLGVLLEEIFPDRLRHMVTIVINPKGAGKKNFGRTEEHALFVIPNSSEPAITANFILDLNRVGVSSELAEEDDDEDEEQDDGAEGIDDSTNQEVSDIDPDELPFPIEDLNQWELRHARRRGNESSYRHQRKNQFYPIYIDEKKGTVEEIGVSIPLEEQPSHARKGGLTPIWPIDKEGNERCWRFIPSSMRRLLEEDRLVVGRKDTTSGTYTLNIWEPKTKYKKVKTVWWHSRHDAGSHGTSLLHKILGRRAAFPFPKSLYAVRDTLLTAIARKPDALVLDFFAGSGTTLHATALINAQLGGNRRCILVSNNEPGEKVAKKLIRQGILPGDEKFEAAGICESVTWPRCKYVLNGKRDNGVKLQGQYLDIEGHPKQLRQSDGFEENMEYFHLEFLDPDEVARGDAFKAVLPILWLMAGAIGDRTDSKGTTTWYLPKHSPFAVLIKEKDFASFKKALHERDGVNWVFLVTDSEESFGQMRRALGKRYTCVQLYKSYLENFRINAPEILQH